MADHVTDLMKKAFLAGVGAAAEGSEKADQLLKDLIQKGELTVEQGKALNQELKHNLDRRLHKEEKKDLSALLKDLSQEDLRELKRKLDQIDPGEEKEEDDLD